MQEQIKEYCALLRRLVGLQLRLIRAFEAEVEVTPLPSDFPRKLRNNLEGVIKAGLSVSQVLYALPDNIGIIPLLAWVKPTRGIVKLEERNWFFDVQGSAQVRFLGLPSELDVNVLESLRAGRSDVLIGSSGYGPSVDVQYLWRGRVDGVNAWSVSLFAASTGSSLGSLSESDHGTLLNQLAREGFLRLWHHPSPEGDPFFVLAEREVSE